MATAAKDPRVEVMQLSDTTLAAEQSLNFDLRQHVVRELSPLWMSLDRLRALLSDEEQRRLADATQARFL